MHATTTTHHQGKRLRLSPSCLSAAACLAGLSLACGGGSQVSRDSDDGALCDLNCGQGQVCYNNACVVDGGPCVAPEHCRGDMHCIAGRCLPWDAIATGHDVRCSHSFDPLTRIEPTVHCQWPGSHSIDDPESAKVWMTPVVGDLVPGNGTPEVAFISFNRNVNGDIGRVRVIRGDDCSPVWTGPHLAATGHWDSLALGDIDGDGRTELCYRGQAFNRVTLPLCVHGHDGSLKWVGHDDQAQLASTNHRFPQIANVDGQGGPEVVFGSQVFAGTDGRMRLGVDVGANARLVSSGLGDIDGDGTLEAFFGHGVLHLARGSFTAWPQGAAGFTAIGELMHDAPGPEAVVVTSGLLRVYSAAGAILHSFSLPTTAGGPPTIADLDGDGEAEFATLGQSKYIAYDLDCLRAAVGARQGQCPTDAARARGDGILWEQEIKELSSGVTGSTVFDLEGDGAVEVVYADECWARIFDGVTGAVKVSLPHASGTAFEYPVIADVNGDFFTEIVLPQGAWPTLSCPNTDPLVRSADTFALPRDPTRSYDGITIYADRTGRWAPTRPLWSEYNESFTYRGSDGSVPVQAANSWQTHNSFRQVIAPEGIAADARADLTLSAVQGSYCDKATCDGEVQARVCNRGARGVGAGMMVVFVQEGAPICTATTRQPLAPGACSEALCAEAVRGTLRAGRVQARVNDSIDTPTPVAECRVGNNHAEGEVSLKRQVI
ncbi:MAG: EB domain-containing protein [Polyangiales bacterium]